jgi:hypothetical protein
MAQRLVKLLVIAGILGSLTVLPGVRAPWVYVVLGTLVLAFLGYLQDRILMPHMNRVAAALLDAAIAFVLLYALLWVVPGTRVTYMYLGTAVAAFAVFEFFFHEWVFDRKRYQKGDAS